MLVLHPVNDKTGNPWNFDNVTWNTWYDIHTTFQLNLFVSALVIKFKCGNEDLFSSEAPGPWNCI